MPLIPRQMRRRIPAGGNGRGLAPRKTYQEQRAQNERNAKFFLEKRAQENAQAQAEGRMTPTEIQNMKAEFRQQGINQSLFRAQVCGRVALQKVFTQTYENGGAEALHDKRVSAVGLVLEACVEAANLRPQLDKALESQGSYWPDDIVPPEHFAHAMAAMYEEQD